MKIKKNVFFFFWGGGGGSGRGVGLGGQGRCEQRSEVFVKVQKKIVNKELKFFVIIQKKIGGGGRGLGGRVLGVRVDVNEELKFL